jgi:hypothetical protein
LRCGWAGQDREGGEGPNASSKDADVCIHESIVIIAKWQVDDAQIGMNLL